jgi:acyl-CoA thioesterase I
VAAQGLPGGRERGIGPGMLIEPGDHILFYGDSITDAGRRRLIHGRLGAGYVAVCEQLLRERFPDHELRVTNRGVSGNRVYDLEARLDRDVIRHRPGVVSILIGINDTWRQFDSDLPSPWPDFEAAYRRILERVRRDLGARVVLCEPFLLPIPEDRRAWRPDVEARIRIVRELARQFGYPCLGLDGIFARAATRRPMDYWCPDGVHPTPAGHALIAEHWVKLATEPQ